MQQQDSYADFTPLRQSSMLTWPTMQQQDSYADFAPTRQSSLLTDQTLPMNGTDVYANISVVWPALHKAGELQFERASHMKNVLQNPPTNMPTKSTVNDSEFEETLWTTALDISFSPEKSIDTKKQSVSDVHRPVLNYMSEKISAKRKLSRSPQQLCFNDTLRMDHETLKDALTMDSEESLDATLTMDDDTLSDTLPMIDNEMIFYDDMRIKEKIADTQMQRTGNQNSRRIVKARRPIRSSLNSYY